MAEFTFWIEDDVADLLQQHALENNLVGICDLTYHVMLAYADAIVRQQDADAATEEQKEPEPA